VSWSHKKRQTKVTCDVTGTQLRSVIAIAGIPERSPEPQSGMVIWKTMSRASSGIDDLGGFL
jgi:hypothetical protein